LTDIATLTPSNWLETFQASAQGGSLRADEFLQACEELSIFPALEALGGTHLIVCEPDLLAAIARRGVMTEESLARLVDDSILESALASRLSPGASVIVLAIADERLLLARCRSVLAHHGCPTQVFSFVQHFLPALSCRPGATPSPPDMEAPTASREYLIISGGRTGSMMLLDVLTRNGLGDPREHLRPPIVLLQALRGSTFSVVQWFEGVRRLGVVNDMFGSKFAPNFLFRMWPLLSGPERQYFRQRLAQSRVIYSYREDAVAQAVSMFRAERSNVWEVTSEEGLDFYRNTPPPAFDFDAIAHAYAFTLKYDAAIQQLLASVPGERMGVSYEALSRDRAGTLARVAEFIGAPGALSAPTSVHRKTADEASAEMAERFCHEYRRRTGHMLERPQIARQNPR
jgi:LPS sulfotransferase NodH